MTVADDSDVRLVACVVAMVNLLEVGQDYMRHNGRVMAPTVGVVAGALNATEAALRTLQREHPGLFRR